MTRTYIEVYDPPANPCAVCNGSGSEWKRTRTCEYDLRYHFPIGPCPACSGSGTASPSSENERPDA